MYEAILGKAVEIKPRGEEGSSFDSAAAMSAFRRVWSRSVGTISHRLRGLWSHTVPQQMKQQPMAGWLRYLSEEAAKRIDEAQARLSSSRGRRRVQSREVMSIRPVDVSDYKRVA